MSIYRVLEATARDLDVDVRELIACIPVALLVCLALGAFVALMLAVVPE